MKYILILMLSISCSSVNVQDEQFKKSLDTIKGKYYKDGKLVPIPDTINHKHDGTKFQ